MDGHENVALAARYWTLLMNARLDLTPHLGFGIFCNDARGFHLNIILISFLFF